MIKIFMVFVLLILSGCQVKSKGKPKMRGGNDVQTYCVGRHSIAIPASFSISPVITGILQLQGAGPQDASFDIVVQFDNMTKVKFDKIVQQRRTELQDSESETVDVLRYDKEISDGVRLFRVQEIGDAYFSELYFLRGPAMVKLRLESYRNGFIEAEQKLFTLANSIRERQSIGKNKEASFCLGPVTLHSDLAKESASFTFRDNDGLVIGVDIDTYSRDDSLSLLARMSRDGSVLRDLKVQTELLRARERWVAGMAADEWLGIGLLGRDADERTLKFMLETKRKNPGKATPSISLTLDSSRPLEDGTPTSTRIGNEDALELWDRIIDSIALAEQHKA